MIDGWILKKGKPQKKSGRLLKRSLTLRRQSHKRFKINTKADESSGETMTKLCAECYKEDSRSSPSRGAVLC